MSRNPLFLRLTVLLIFALFVFNSCNDDQGNVIFEEPIIPYQDSWDSLYYQGVPEWEVFDFQASQYNVVVTSSGTRILIWPNTLENYQGEVIQGGYQIAVREMYTVSDAIFNKSFTYNSRGILNSGGQFELAILQDEQQLSLVPDESIIIDVPTDSLDGNMQVFVGGRNGSGEVAWQNTGLTAVNDFDTLNIQGYGFELNQLWAFINCDYFWDDPRQKTNVEMQVLPEMDMTNTKVFVHIPSINSVVPVYGFSYPFFELSGNYQLPIGVRVNFIAISVDEHGNWRYAIQDNSISNNHVEELDFKTALDVEIILEAIAAIDSV